MKRSSMIFSNKTLLTMYKSFVRSPLDYADIIYDPLFSESFKAKLEEILSSHNVSYYHTRSKDGKD